MLFTRVLAVALALIAAAARANDPLPALGADPHAVTVSGVSSGGYMAVQFNVAHSSVVTGAGVLAAGPYYCAQGSVVTAYFNCMTPGTWTPLPGIEQLRAQTEVLARARSIDPTDNLAAARVWLFSGTGDRTVDPSVVDALRGFYARYGVPTAIVARRRLNAKDHPRNSAALAAGLAKDGVDVRLGVEPTAVEAGAGPAGAHVVRLSDGSAVTGHEILLAVGRVAPLDGLGLETIGVALHDGRVRPDDQLRVAEDVFVAGDAAGPEMHTHLAHYQGEMVARIALGDDVRPDFRAVPRATYTDPETAGVGMTGEEARRAGLDAFEESIDLATSAKGYVADAGGHCTVVVDRGSRTIVGAFIAGPGASEAIHLAVLAVKIRTPLAVLADTITAFPTTSRVLGTAFTAALATLGR